MALFRKKIEYDEALKHLKSSVVNSGFELWIMAKLCIPYKT